MRELVQSRPIDSNVVLRSISCSMVVIDLFMALTRVIVIESGYLWSKVMGLSGEVAPPGVAALGPSDSSFFPDWYCF